MQITEIYKSLQGESTHAGPAVSLRPADRLQSCAARGATVNNVQGGRKMAIEEVPSEVDRLSPGGGLVEITGGEPMLQERELVPLMRRLLEEGYSVLLETSGERPLERVPAGSASKSSTSSVQDIGEADTFRIGNLETLTARDEVKFVLSSRAGYQFARDFTPTAPSGATGECRFVLAGLSQGCHRRSG